MLVEVEHSPNKYWLASVIATFDRLLQLKWEGATNGPDFWLDLKSRKCYPVTFYRKNQDFKIEPPPNLRLESKDIVGVTFKYFSKDVQQTTNSAKLSIYTNYGYTNPVEIFQQGIIVEVIYESEPDKVWFASVVQNCGGRLLLKWINRLDFKKVIKLTLNISKLNFFSRKIN